MGGGGSSSRLRKTHRSTQDLVRLVRLGDEVGIAPFKEAAAPSWSESSQRQNVTEILDEACCEDEADRDLSSSFRKLSTHSRQPSIGSSVVVSGISSSAALPKRCSLRRAGSVSPLVAIPIDKEDASHQSEPAVVIPGQSPSGIRDILHSSADAFDGHLPRLAFRQGAKAKNLSRMASGRSLEASVVSERMVHLTEPRPSTQNVVVNHRDGDHDEDRLLGKQSIVSVVKERTLSTAGKYEATFELTGATGSVRPQHRVVRSRSPLTGSLVMMNEDILARKVTTLTTSNVSTYVFTQALYMAPEVHSQRAYNEKADVYSFGMMMYELFSRSFVRAKVADPSKVQGQNDDATFCRPLVLPLPPQRPLH